MTMSSLGRKASTSAAAFRTRYLTSSAIQSSTASRLTAVVVGATSGIGEACAHRLAEQGYSVIAVGRDRPGRAEQVVRGLNAKTAAVEITTGEDNKDEKREKRSHHSPTHEFRSCDAFSLNSVHNTAKEIMKNHEAIDALILTQGMATTQSFTPTATEENDEKLTLHYWSRMAFAFTLLPALRNSQLPGGAVVLSVLSGGVHSPYTQYKDDPELKKNYSMKNAADIAGFYNDLGFDALARMEENCKINFVHASPGFVNTNWGSELPWYMKKMVRVLQPLGRKASDCAEYMLGPTVFSSAAGGVSMERPQGETKGIFIMNSDGKADKLTDKHTEEGRKFVWGVTANVMRRARIEVPEN